MEKLLHLSYFSKDGEEGYPGNLTAAVDFTSASMTNCASTIARPPIATRSSTSPIIPISISWRRYNPGP